MNKQWLPEREAKGQHPELVWWPGLASEEGCTLLCNKSKGAEAECGSWEVWGPGRREESPLGVSNFFMKDGGVHPWKGEETMRGCGGAGDLRRAEN